MSVFLPVNLACVENFNYSLSSNFVMGRSMVNSRSYATSI